MIQDIKKSDLCGAQYGEFIEDIKAKLKARPNYSLEFTFREGNFVVHVLANLGFNFLSKLVWVETFPDEVSQYVISDAVS